LLNVKQRFEVLEAKEQERDHKIHIIIVENKDLLESNKFLEAKEQERDYKIHIITAKNKVLAESNKILKEQVASLQEPLLIGKTK